MTWMTWPEMDAHKKWIHAFNWWFHSGGNTNRIIDNLRAAVHLSPKNAMFLAAVLDGEAKPLTGKQQGLARFTRSIIDNKIHDLKARHFTRKGILADLKRTGLVKQHVAITAIHARMARKTKSPGEIHAKLEEKFHTLYATITKNVIIDD